MDEFDEIVVNDALKVIPDEVLDGEEYEEQEHDEDYAGVKEPSPLMSPRSAVTIAGLPDGFQLGKIWTHATPEARATALRCAEMILRVFTHKIMGGNSGGTAELNDCADEDSTTRYAVESIYQ